MKDISMPLKSTGLLSNLTRVDMRLRNVLYVSYLVPASNVRPLVPKVLPLSSLSGNTVFISVVILQSTGVRLRALPFPSFTYNQINIRTYVVDPKSGNHAVYFIRSGVTSALTSFITRLAGIPWQHINLNIHVRGNGQGPYASYRADGEWNKPFLITAESAYEQEASFQPFANMESAIDFLVRPLIGFFGHGEQARRFTIWHPDITPRAFRVTSFRFPLLSSLHVLDDSMMEKPDNVLMVTEATFHIYMPPTKVKIN